MGFDDSSVENPTLGEGRENVLALVQEVIGELRRDGQAGASGKGMSTLQRYRHVIAKNAPRVKTTARVMSADLVRWMNRGGPWRAGFILSTGIVTSIGLSGVFVFLLVLMTVTVNAIIVALLGSVAAVGAVAALFFTALAGIYVGVLTIAFCVISTVIFFTTIAVLSVAGWIAFWWVVWLGAKKIFQVAQGSYALTTSTLQKSISSDSG